MERSTASASGCSSRASSSDTVLVPDANIVLGGSGANQTVTVTPASNQSGSATITLTVSDGTASSTDTFVLTVGGVNDVPTIRIVGYEREPFVFEFQSQSARHYVVEATDDLKDWETLKSYNGTGTLIRFDDERGQVFPQIYYRVRVAE